ncbi:unnamed protein product [Trichobilharzia regenti]|nr:unnamed protein product [Trichobilharzia regenti]
MNDDDVIMLSEDEDDSLLGALCDEMEKENTPKPSLLSKSRALILKLENELRNEESALMLLQQLRTNQRSHALQPKGTKTPSATPTARNTQSPVNHAPALNSNVPNSQNTSTIPKVTKSMAIHALEQQCNGKKAMLRKQLERTLDKVALPKPAVGNGLCVVPFVPSTLTNEFTALIGLEEIVNTIQSKPVRSHLELLIVNCEYDLRKTRESIAAEKQLALVVTRDRRELMHVDHASKLFLKLGGPQSGSLGLFTWLKVIARFLGYHSYQNFGMLTITTDF